MNAHLTKGFSGTRRLKTHRPDAPSAARHGRAFWPGLRGPWAAPSASGVAELVEDPSGVVGLPGFAWAGGGVFLVEADEQISQLAADKLGVQQRGQFGEVDKPVGVPGGPVVVGTINDPEHAMVGFAGLVEQVTDLLGGGGCHLVPRRGRSGVLCPGASLPES